MTIDIIPGGQTGADLNAARSAQGEGVPDAARNRYVPNPASDGLPIGSGDLALARARASLYGTEAAPTPAPPSQPPRATSQSPSGTFTAPALSPADRAARLAAHFRSY